MYLPNTYIMDFKSLRHLLDHFKNEKTGITYFEKIRWNGNPVCPHCTAEKPYKTTRGYRCSNTTCRKDFTVKVGTIFENSKIPFRVWFAAIYLINAHKKGISSVQLATDLGVTQKTAWFMMHRIREMLVNKSPQMLRVDKVVEIDETFVGGKEKNRHYNKKESATNPGFSNDGKPYNKKKIVLGIIERGGQVVLKHVASTMVEDLIPQIKKHVPLGATVMTDEHVSYFQLKHIYDHDTVNHKEKEYVRGKAYTNTIENFWSVLKRTLYGTYHTVSTKHFDRYLNECAGRFNSRFITSSSRMDNCLANSVGWLPYKILIANKAK